MFYGVIPVLGWRLCAIEAHRTTFFGEHLIAVGRAGVGWGQNWPNAGLTDEFTKCDRGRSARAVSVPHA